MNVAFRSALALTLVGLVVAAAPAHFNMLLPDKHSLKKDETATFIYQWGHPFEHQLFDAPAPASLVVLTPSNQKIDLARRLEKIGLPSGEGQQVAAYRLSYTPEQRGDHVFLLATPPIWLEQEREFVQDHVKVVLHVQSQKGWMGDLGEDFNLLPLTRPYGLLPGMVFRTLAQVPPPPGPGSNQLSFNAIHPLAGSLVEIERYNPAPPKVLPPDEHITRTVLNDTKGVAVFTLPDPGWWSVTAQRDGGTRERAGKAYPVRQRATLWVFVDEKSR